MDNDGFRALVKERTREKSTKEIAREVVEEEFQRKKKRRRGRGGGDSSDSEDETRRRKKEKDSNEKKQKGDYQSERKPRKVEESSKYRDRARERREGKNVDYAASESLLKGLAQSVEGGGNETELSKYLGGDEAHTHLVKGLDVALARKVKREMGRSIDQNTDMASVRQEATEDDSGEESTATPMTEREARHFLERHSPGSFKSILGRGMFLHLRNAFVKGAKLATNVNSTQVGRSLQRSSLLFSTNGDPRDRIRAWEIPQETIAAKEENTFNNSLMHKPLLEKIKAAFSQQQAVTWTSHSAREGVSDDGKGGLKEGQETTPKSTPLKDDDGSDDDIFANAGDYVPPTAQNKTGEGAATGREEYGKGKIFDGLVVAEAKQNESINQTTQNPPRLAISAKPRAPKQVTLSTYEGGYGEEMDVDFEGRFEDEGNSKRDRADLTMGVREYGRRGKPPKDSAD